MRSFLLPLRSLLWNFFFIRHLASLLFEILWPFVTKQRLKKHSYPVENWAFPAPLLIFGAGSTYADFRQFPGFCVNFQCKIAREIVFRLPLSTTYPSKARLPLSSSFTLLPRYYYSTPECLSVSHLQCDLAQPDALCHPFQVRQLPCLLITPVLCSCSSLCYSAGRYHPLRTLIIELLNS